MSLTQPLELKHVLSMPERRLDTLAMIDIIVIAFFLSMLGSRFIFAPGVTVDLSLELPASSQSNLVSVPTDAVLTVKVLTAKRNNMYIFNDSIYTLAALEQMFQNYDKALNEERDAILLVKADKTVTMGTFTKLVELARIAHFSKIQLASVVEPQRQMN